MHYSSETWGERQRRVFIEEATKRGFRDVTFERTDNSAAYILCDDGRKGYGQMDEVDQVSIWARVHRLTKR